MTTVKIGFVACTQKWYFFKQINIPAAVFTMEKMGCCTTSESTTNN